MTTNVEIDTNIDEQIEKVQKLIKLLETAEEKANLIQFISIKDFSKLTGWSEKTVQELYNKPDFPSTDYGKEKKAEIHAIISYFSVPRRK